MAEGLVALVPAPAPGGVRAVINGVIATKTNLANAEVAVGLQRVIKFDEQVGLFVAGTKGTVSPPAAVKARLDLEALCKAFDDQESAIKFWRELIDERLTTLAAKSGPEVISVLNEHLTVLKNRHEQQQGDVEQFKLQIAELNEWIAYRGEAPEGAGACLGVSPADRFRPVATRSPGGCQQDPGTSVQIPWLSEAQEEEDQVGEPWAISQISRAPPMGSAAAGRAAAGPAAPAPGCPSGYIKPEDGDGEEDADEVESKGTTMAGLHPFEPLWPRT